MTVDWRRLKAVVIESDDWGLCAWSPDDAAARALAGTPVWSTPAGTRYGRSTLESAADVRSLVVVLAGVRGADGEPPVLQANTVMAADAHIHGVGGRRKPSSASTRSGEDSRCSATLRNNCWFSSDVLTAPCAAGPAACRYPR